MEHLRLAFIIWGSFGFITTLIGLTIYWNKTTDPGIKISGSISLAYGFLTALSAWLALEPLPPWWFYSVAINGVVIIAFSQALTFWARKTMGKSFTPDLSPNNESKLVTTGPFAICRHPMMLSYLMLWVGTALALGSAILFVSFCFVSVAVMRRVALEEKALKTKFGEEYEKYRQKVSLIVPFLNPNHSSSLEIEEAVAEPAKPDWYRHIGKCRW